MTTISAKVVADSVCTVSGQRITTMLLKYPRWIHAELMTHRVFSRNASSSRAIPFKRLLTDMLADPAYPIYWGSNQKGMQAGAPLKGWRLAMVKTAWWVGKWTAAGAAWLADKAGAHKQVVNRLIEPFSHITVVVTATQWTNWDALRCHKDAEPHIQDLAYRMKAARLASFPAKLKPGQWHLPFVDTDIEDDGDQSYRMWMTLPGDPVNGFFFISKEEAIKVSVARCARTSYYTHDLKPTTIGADIELHDKLVDAVPLHASPAEHQATPDPYAEARHQWGNFSYWIQYRKTLPGECQ